MIKLKIINNQKPLKLKFNVHFPNVVLANLQEKNVIPTKEAQEIIADEQYDGLSKVTVESIPNEYVVPSGTLEVVENGEYDVVEKARVNVQTPIPKLDTKIINANGIYNAIDDNLDGYSSVNVEISGGDPELEASYLSLIDDSVGANTTKLPNGLTSIGNYAFYYKSNLTLTELPNTITSIGNNAFSSCSKLALNSLPSGLTSIGNNAFYNCRNMTIDEIPSAIKRIANSVFQSCSNITISELPSEITSLEDNAFRGCSKVTIKEIPEKIIMINSFVFQNCTSITEQTWYGAIQYVYANSFANCSNLTKLVLPNVARVPNLVNVNAFTNTPIANGTGYIYVPNNLVDSFKSATNWSTYANQIKGLSELEG